MQSKQQSIDVIGELIERFDYHIKEYKAGIYNETQTRNDFINPFFEALGWDINNRAGLAESYREVIHEARQKVEHASKAPDYCFTVYGQRKFFVEAKKPSVDIKDAIDPAYQLRRYGWSAKMPISIITDFEEFSIYDCTVKPSPTDRSSVSRIKYLNFKDYLSEIDFLWDTFSKEQVLKGSFDKYISSNKGKKGTTGVDAEFLKSLDSWRDILARNIVNRNNSIGEDELNYSLQKIIDRIIFLRICEDRGVELEGQLQKSLGSNVYDNLKVLFHSADQKYNSGLFDYKKDTITDSLSIDDKTLKTIIEEMYYPKSPYEFSVIPVEILGHSYEQYLGKVIRITPGHRIKIEEKPEVRKAGGVYYTPQYIVDYIVKNTVGKLVEDKTPDEVSKIKICDPACGSGSFLLGAYQFLLDWHRSYYQNLIISSSTPGLTLGLNTKSKFLTPDGNLTTSIKKQILINNIFGVDIDTNAVEVTKLSLMLKAMEGETEASINNQLSLLQERILPTLDNNIKSGNSLIDIDFYDNQLDFEPNIEKKVKPFNWQSAFPDVFKNKIHDEKLEAFHITWVTYNSRPEGKNNVGSPVILNDDSRNEVAKYLDEKISDQNYRIISLNVLHDHVHAILVCTKEQLPSIIANLKGYSSYMLHKNTGEINLRVNPEVDAPQYADGTRKKLWAKDYSTTFLNDENHILNAMVYIENNHKKHEITPLEYKFKFLTPLSKAFEPRVEQGGFDAVIGNPPYIKIQTMMESSPESVDYLKKNYFSAASKNIDIYVTFLEKSYRLINLNGFTGFILPHKFFQAQMGENIRHFLASKNAVQDIISFGANQIFENATTYTCLFFLSRRENSSLNYTEFKLGEEINLNGNTKQIIKIIVDELKKEKWNFYDSTSSVLFDKLQQMPVKLKDITRKIFVGLQTSADEIYVLKRTDFNDDNKQILTCYSKSLGRELQIERGLIKPFLMGKDVKRYKPLNYNVYVIFPYRIINGKAELMNQEYLKTNFPLGWEYLLENKSVLENREKGKMIGERFYAYIYPKNLAEFDCIKITFPDITNKSEFSYDFNGKMYHTTTVYSLAFNEKAKHNSMYYLGLFNSSLTWFFVSQNGTILRGGYTRFHRQYIENFAIPNLDLTNSEEKAQHDKMVELVQTMLQLNKDLQNATLPEQKEQLKARIDYTDMKIDRLVYQLYDLTEEEIKIVEGE